MSGKSNNRISEKLRRQRKEAIRKVIKKEAKWFCVYLAICCGLAPLLVLMGL